MRTILVLPPLRSPAENRENGIAPDRLIAYEKGELTLDEIAALAQDIYEAGVLGSLTPRYFLLHQHMKRIGLLHGADRPFH